MTPVAAVPPVREEGSDDPIRALIDARREEILLCTGDTPVGVRAAWSEGAVTIALQGALAGTDQEGCVQHLFSGAAAPAGTGSLIHVVRP